MSVSNHNVPVLSLSVSGTGIVPKGYKFLVLKFRGDLKIGNARNRGSVLQIVLGEEGAHAGFPYRQIGSVGVDRFKFVGCIDAAAAIIKRKLKITTEIILQILHAFVKRAADGGDVGWYKGGFVSGNVSGFIGWNVCRWSCGL